MEVYLVQQIMYCYVYLIKNCPFYKLLTPLEWVQISNISA